MGLCPHHCSLPFQKGSFCHSPATHEPHAVWEFRVRAAPWHHRWDHTWGSPGWPQDAGNRRAEYRLEFLKLPCQLLSPTLPGLGTSFTQVMGAEEIS